MNQPGSIPVTCPACRASLQIKSTATAKNFKCSSCGVSSPILSAITPPAEGTFARRAVVGIAVFAFLVGGLGGCMAGCSYGQFSATHDSTSSTKRTSTRLPGETSAPAYKVTTGVKSSSLIVTVVVLPTQAQAEAIVADLQREHVDNPDGYFVQINCSTGGTDRMDNRLANGRFAVGPIGSVRTGLPEGGSEVELVSGQQCPAPTGPTAAPGAVTARQVVNAVIAAGLPATDPRDNSANFYDIGCVQLITTDDFSVYQFADSGQAEKWATGLGEEMAYRRGLLVMKFNIGRTSGLVMSLIPEYKSVLDQVTAG